MSVPRADFYLIDKPRFRDEPLLLVCELARKAFDANLPTVVLARSIEQAEQLDELLWSFDEDAYIPHQIAGDEDDAETAVLIVPPGIAAEERPLAINLRDAIARGKFESVKEVVPAEESERAGSRERWSEYRKMGYECRKFDM